MTQNELNKSLPETTSRGYRHIKKILDQGADIEESAAHSREFIRELAAQDLLFNHIFPDIIITVHSYQYIRGQDNGTGV